ncbi:MAG: DUF4830 domain-containing protein [Ruminococcus sp.]|jgi:hypothetical protein|nr:DUF4830 domain-containing protein [Ruminococcus sp.]
MARAKKSKKVLIILIIVLVCIGLTVFFVLKARQEKALDEVFAMASNSERIGFLNSQGWIVKPDPLREEVVTLPTEFNDAFGEYLKLQESQGFDLVKYAGEDVTIYVYEILNYPDYPEGIQANMIVNNDRLIGGEIRQDAENGFIIPLITVSYIDPYDAVEEAEVTDPAVTTVSAVQPTITIETTTATALPQVILEDAMYSGYDFTP